MRSIAAGHGMLRWTDGAGYSATVVPIPEARFLVAAIVIAFVVRLMLVALFLPLSALDFFDAPFASTHPYASHP